MHSSDIKLTKIFEIAMLSLVLMVGFCASAIGAEKKTVQYLFVQSAHSVSFSDNTMTLHGVSPTTLFFSDRPERVAGHGSTEEYVKNWRKGDDSFAADPPNATLSILGDDDTEVINVVVTLKDPKLSDGNLSYIVAVLDGNAPVFGGANSLFIDVIWY